MEGRMAHQLAIDRPSHKFVSFLKKHYGLKNAVPQVGQKSLIKGHLSKLSYTLCMMSQITLLQKISLKNLSRPA